MRLPRSSSGFANSHTVRSDVKLPCLDCDVASKYCSIVKLGRIMAFLLQSLKDFADNRYSLLGGGGHGDLRCCGVDVFLMR